MALAATVSGRSVVAPNNLATMRYDGCPTIHTNKGDSTMGEAFHQGGWGMYPTAIAGLIAIAAAVHFVRNPDPERIASVRGLAALTFLIGCLGSVTGMIKSFTSIGGDADVPVRYALIGLGESLNCVALAMVCMVIAGISVAIGRARANARGADLADPHAP